MSFIFVSFWVNLKNEKNKSKWKVNMRRHQVVKKSGEEEEEEGSIKDYR